MCKLDFDVELIESVFKTEIASHGFVSDAMIDLFRKQMHKEVDVKLDQIVDAIQPVGYKKAMKAESTIVKHADLLLAETPISTKIDAPKHEYNWASTYAKLLDLPESMLSSFDFGKFKNNQFGSKHLNQYEFNTILYWLRDKYYGMNEFEFVEDSDNKFIHVWRKHSGDSISPEEDVLLNMEQNRDVAVFMRRFINSRD